MSARDAIVAIDVLEAAGIDAWLDGGWAVDAVLETQSRPHDDLDLVVSLDDAGRVVDALRHLGYELARGNWPQSFELVDQDGRQIDVHPVVFTPNGDGLYRMENDEEWVYPAEGFAGRGRILDLPVRCLTPEVQMLCHTGYEPHVGSYEDVWALSRRFGLAVPYEYMHPRDAYRAR
jgi:lincosamide nucleotidyltransferase A/C/D/E